AENSRSSALDLDDARPLSAALAAVEHTFDGPDWEQPLAALEAEERRQADAPGRIALELRDHPMAEAIAPWVHELGAHATRGLETTALRRARRRRLSGLRIARGRDGMHVRGRALPPEVATITRLGPGFEAEAASIAARIGAPPLGQLVSGLGNLL